MRDLIDRQAAIDAVMKHGKKIPTYAIACKMEIEQLPSAQPKEVFEIGKPYPLKGFEFKIWKDAYGDDWVEIRKYQEPWEGEQDG